MKIEKDEEIELFIR